MVHELRLQGLYVPMRNMDLDTRELGSLSSFTRLELMGFEPPLILDQPHVRQLPLVSSVACPCSTSSDKSATAST